MTLRMVMKWLVYVVNFCREYCTMLLVGAAGRAGSSTVHSPGSRWRRRDWNFWCWWRGSTTSIRGPETRRHCHASWTETVCRRLCYELSRTVCAVFSVLWLFCLGDRKGILLVRNLPQFIQKFSFITSTHTYTEKDNCQHWNLTLKSTSQVYGGVPNFRQTDRGMGYGSCSSFV